MSAGSTRASGRPTFRGIRIAALLGLLLFTLAWAAHTSFRRWARGRWDRPLQIGVVLLDPSGDADPQAWRAGAAALEARLDAERVRWRGAGPPAFQLTVVGPVRWTGTLPFSPPTAAPLDRAWHALDVWSTVRDVDRAADGAAGGFDVRVFVLVEPVRQGQVAFAEGSGAVNGEIAFVRGSARGDLSIPLQAIGHELLHTVGASDKYDDSGHARDPEGLVDPGRVPPYPQPKAEWMVGEVPLGPGRGRLPESLAELSVGPVTAREIGWVR